MIVVRPQRMIVFEVQNVLLMASVNVALCVSCCGPRSNIVYTGERHAMW